MLLLVYLNVIQLVKNCLLYYVCAKLLQVFNLHVFVLLAPFPFIYIASYVLANISHDSKRTALLDKPLELVRGDIIFQNIGILCCVMISCFIVFYISFFDTGGTYHLWSFALCLLCVPLRAKSRDD